jgi:hypothetical protein
LHPSEDVQVPSSANVANGSFGLWYVFPVTQVPTSVVPAATEPDDPAAVEADGPAAAEPDGTEAAAEATAFDDGATAADVAAVVLDDWLAHPARKTPTTARTTGTSALVAIVVPRSGVVMDPPVVDMSLFERI